MQKWRWVVVLLLRPIMGQVDFSWHSVFFRAIALLCAVIGLINASVLHCSSAGGGGGNVHFSFTLFLQLHMFWPPIFYSTYLASTGSWAARVSFLVEVVAAAIRLLVTLAVAIFLLYVKWKVNTFRRFVVVANSLLPALFEVLAGAAIGAVAAGNCRLTSTLLLVGTKLGSLLVFIWLLMALPLLQHTATGFAKLIVQHNGQHCSCSPCSIMVSISNFMQSLQITISSSFVTWLMFWQVLQSVYELVREIVLLLLSMHLSNESAFEFTRATLDVVYYIVQLSFLFCLCPGPAVKSIVYEIWGWQQAQAISESQVAAAGSGGVAENGLETELDSHFQHCYFWWGMFEALRVFLYYFGLRVIIAVQTEACLAFNAAGSAFFCVDIPLWVRVLVVVLGLLVSVVLKPLREQFKLMNVLYMYESFKHALSFCNALPSTDARVGWNGAIPTWRQWYLYLDAETRPSITSGHDENDLRVQMDKANLIEAGYAALQISLEKS